MLVHLQDHVFEERFAATVVLHLLVHVLTEVVQGQQSKIHGHVFISRDKHTSVLQELVLGHLYFRFAFFGLGLYANIAVLKERIHGFGVVAFEGDDPGVGLMEPGVGR